MTISTEQVTEQPQIVTRSEGGNDLPKGVDSEIDAPAVHSDPAAEAALNALAAPDRVVPPPAPNTVEAKRFQDEDRDAIIDGYAARRNQENNQIRVEEPAPAEGETQPAPAAEPSSNDLPRAIEVDPEALVKIKVNGVEHLVKYGDVIANAQLRRATQEELDQAKRLTEEARRLHSVASNQGGVTQPSTTDPAPKPKAQPQVLEIARKVVDAIQTGGVDEGAEAVVELLANAVPQPSPASPSNLREQLRTALEEEREQEALAGATEAFNAKFPAVQTDAVVQGAFAAVMQREYLRDIMGASGYSAEQVRQIAPTPAKMLEVHRTLRAEGVSGLRTDREVLQAAQSDQRFQQIALATPDAKPQPLTIDVNRQERKQVVQPQPVFRSAPPSPAQRQGAPRERVYADAVAEERAARGQ